MLEERLLQRAQQPPLLSQLPPAPRPSAFTPEEERRLLTASVVGRGGFAFPSAVDRLPGHTSHSFSSPRQQAGAHWGVPQAGDGGRLDTAEELLSPVAGLRNAPAAPSPRRGGGSASSGLPPDLRTEIVFAAAAGAGAASRAATAAAKSASGTPRLQQHSSPRQGGPVVSTTSAAAQLMHPYSASVAVTPSPSLTGSARLVTAPRSGRTPSATASTAAAMAPLPVQRQYQLVLQAAKGSRAVEVSSFRQEMEDIDSVSVEGVECDSPWDVSLSVSRHLSQRFQHVLQIKFGQRTQYASVSGRGEGLTALIPTTLPSF